MNIAITGSSGNIGGMVAKVLVVGGNFAQYIIGLP